MSVSEFDSSSSAFDDPSNAEQELSHIRNALRGLRYGTVQIFVQDGVVVQIERTEKRRIRRTKPNGPR